MPIEAFWFGQDLRVISSAPEYRNAIGTRIVKIGSTLINEVRPKLQQLIPQGESEWFELDRSAGLITQIEPLAVLHIIPYSDTAQFTFETDSGSRFTLHLRADAPGKNSSLILGDQVPLPFQQPDAPFWFTYLSDSGSIYVNFRSYQDLEEQTKRLWDFISQHPAKRLIVDMRWNAAET